MPDKPPALLDSAIHLLFRTIELPGARIAGSVLQDHFESAALSLRTAKLLVANGYALSAAALGDHDDTPVELIWIPELNGYGYSSPSGKIVEVPSERISYFKADIESVMGRLASPVVRGRKSKPVSLVEDVLWALGEVEIGSGGRTASLWFARRLHDNAEWEKVQRTIRDRPAPHLRIVLTTTAAHRFGNALFQNHLIVPLVDILRHGSGLTIDRSILLSRVRNPYGSNSSLIQHSADYAFISIGGKDYKFPGSKQRAVVARLLQAFEARTPRCSTADVLFDAGFKDSVNTLAKAFSGRDDWKDFMAEANGMSWAFV